MTKRKRVLSLVMAALMLLALTPAGSELRPTAYAVTQDDIDSLKGDAKDLASQRAEVKSELAALRSDRAGNLQPMGLTSPIMYFPPRRSRTRSPRLRVTRCC